MALVILRRIFPCPPNPIVIPITMGIQTLAEWIPAFAGITIKFMIMIIQVIPAKRMPLSLSFLDYSVPEEFANKIKIGQLVKIPFRNKEEFGVVLNIKPSSASNIKTKSVKEIVFTEPVLSKEQLNFLVDISEFYHVSLGFLLKGNLLPLQKAKLKKVSPTEHSPLWRGRPARNALACEAGGGGLASA